VTEAFFPGSRIRATPPAGLRDTLDGLTGKFYPVGNQQVELFTISQLAEALNREPVTVRGWEHKGFIPKATFSKPGKGGDVRGRRRLYSRAQVEALVSLAQEEGLLADKHKKITETNFAGKALLAFKQIARQQ
jgi:hypothetical protein